MRKIYLLFFGVIQSFASYSQANIIPDIYTASTPVTICGTVTVNVDEHNVGNVNAASNYIKVYFSNDAVLGNSDDVYIGQIFAQGPAAQNYSPIYQQTFLVPSNTTTGLKYLYFWLDATNLVPETIENDNYMSRMVQVNSASIPTPSPVFGTSSCPGTSTTTTVPLTWAGTNSSYRINISKYPYGTTPFNNIIYTASCVTGNSLQVSDPNIFPGMLYRWNMTGFTDPTCATCQSATSVNTNYFYIPPTITPSTNQSICSGQFVNFSTPNLNAQINSPGILTYQWLLNGNPINGATGTTYNTTVPGNYSVRLNYSGSSNCSSTSIQSSVVSVTSQACCTPTNQASGINFTNNNTGISVTANWTNGNGTGERIVKVNTVNSFTTPVNGIPPTNINSSYPGNGEQIVYYGAGNNVSVNNLMPNQTYYFRVYETNCSGNQIVYNTSTNTLNPNSVQIQTVGQVPVANFSTSTPTLIVGQSATLFDLSSNNPTSWSWIVDREQWNGSYTTISSSNQKNPVFSFNTSACYRISLTATNAAGSGSLTRQCYIYAKPDLNAPIPSDVTRAQKYYTYKGGDPVNLANGSFSFSMKDFSIPGINTKLDLERRYFSNSQYESIFGIGWHHSFDIKVDVSNAFDWVVQYPDGHNEHYAPYQNGETRSLYPGNFDTLTYVASGSSITSFTHLNKDGIRWDFNSAGQINSITDLDGNQTTFSYLSGKLISVTLPGSRSLQFTYNGFNKVATVTDNIGRAVFYYYDATGHNLDSTRIANSTTSFRYGSGGMTEVYDPRGNRIVQNLYNAQVQVYEQYDAENKKTTFQYNTPFTGITTVTDPLLKNKIIKHDNKSRCIEIKNELNEITKYGFSQNNTLDTLIDARGFQTVINHDDKGNQIKTTNAKGYSDSTGYTLLNKPNYIRDKENNIYKTIYSSTGNPTHIILPTGDTIKKSYDTRGLDTLITDARGFKTKKVYNALGDLILTITPTSITSIVYDGVGRPIEITDSYGRKDSLFWNHFDQVIKQKDKMSRVEEFGFDENGNQILYKDKNGEVTTTIYNKYDKPVKITEPQNHITEYEYDDNQRKKKARDPNRNTVIFNYDDAGRILSIADSILGTVSQKTYDPSGNVITITDGVGKLWTNRVDEINRITSTINPLGDSIQYKYNKNNLSIEQIDEEGKSTKWEYDAASRQVKTTDARNNFVQRFLNKNGLTDSIRDARGNIRNKATYDGSDRLLTLNDGFGNYSTVWDSSGNVKTITDPNNRTLSYFYNNNSELLDIKVGSSTVRHYLLNNNGDFTEANSGTQNSSVIRNQLGWITEYTDNYSNSTQLVYDSIGNVKNIIYPGGKSVQYKYNSLNKCIEVKDWTNGIFTITRNNNGGITSILYSNNFKTEITRDDASRVSSWINKSNINSVFQSNLVGRDKAGNFLRDSGIHVLLFTPAAQFSTGTYGKDDRLSIYGNAICTTNVSGQRTHLSAPGKSYSYTWSGMSELDNTTHTTLAQSMQYDAFNERRTKTTVQGTTRYVIDHSMASFPLTLQERDNTNQEIINYLYVPGEGIVLARDSLGTLRFYHHDIKGNTIALSDISGQITDKYEYSDFGDSISHIGGSAQPFTWMGMYGIQHDGNGLFYMHARYYDGKTNTFISKDPHPINYLNTQEINRYVYGYNNPLKYIDPTGLIAQNNTSYDNLLFDPANLTIDDFNYSFWQKTKLIWNNSWNQALATGVSELKNVENWKTSLALVSLFDMPGLSLVKQGITESKILGTLGEKAVGIGGPKIAINVSGKTRIPDRLTANFLEEVKNVKYQSLTSQLKDFIQYSQDNALQMILHTRSNTILSESLKHLINIGVVIHKVIPGF